MLSEVWYHLSEVSAEGSDERYAWAEWRETLTMTDTQGPRVLVLAGG